jgi:hypothetical protein
VDIFDTDASIWRAFSIYRRVIKRQQERGKFWVLSQASLINVPMVDSISLSFQAGQQFAEYSFHLM